MKETLPENTGNHSQPPCKSKGFTTYVQLLEGASKKNRAAEECLGRVCEKLLIPHFMRKYPRLAKEDIEDICWDSLLQFIFKLRAGEPINIGLLWRMANLDIIDFCRKKGLELIDMDALGETLPYERNITEEEVLALANEFRKWLDNEEAILFDLHYLGNKNIEAVKDLLGWSNGRISRIKERINEKAKAYAKRLRD